MGMNEQHGWAGTEGDRLRLDRRKLIAFAKKLGATVEDDSTGNWRVLQLIAPPGKLWAEGIRCIKVEWPSGEHSEPACRDAYQRLSSMADSPFRAMTEQEKDFYTED